MKKLNLFFPIVALSVFSLQLNASDVPSEADLRLEAISIVKKFAGTLKPKLKQGIESGGLDNAVKICAVEAPKIASDLSNETGWSIKRVSLKPRNKSKATPDAFEREVLVKFNERQAQGESPSVLEYSELFDNKFRYMKAQGTEAMCLGCHGDTISPEVAKLINEHYPDDAAKAYSLGEVRGAFSLIKDL